jgi:hypothetical protein
MRVDARYSGRMKKLFLSVAIAATLAVTAAAQSQDREALRMAEKVAAAFSNGLAPLDHRYPLRARLHVTKQYDIYDVGQREFEYKTFRSFTAMDRWMKREQQEDGTPFRMSGQRVSCRRGLCRLDLVDNQMAHNHVFLTRIWYGRSHGKIYIRKLRLLYG